MLLCLIRCRYVLQYRSNDTRGRQYNSMQQSCLTACTSCPNHNMITCSHKAFEAPFAALKTGGRAVTPTTTLIMSRAAPHTFCASATFSLASSLASCLSSPVCSALDCARILSTAWQSDSRTTCYLYRHDNRIKKLFQRQDTSAVGCLPWPADSRSNTKPHNLLMTLGACDRNAAPPNITVVCAKQPTEAS